MRVPIVLAGAVCAIGASVPTVTLKNAANAGVNMPIVGKGTGGYTGTNAVYASYPPAECFNACNDPMCVIPDPVNFTLTSCEKFVQAAVSTWIQLGGRRIDGSASYHNVGGIVGVLKYPCCAESRTGCARAATVCVACDECKWRSP